MNPSTVSSWDLEQARSTYGFERWAGDYFGLSEAGEITVALGHDRGVPRQVPITEIVQGVRDRGMDLPMLLSFGELLEARVRLLHESFATAIRDEGYKGTYHGVFPIKVNQQQRVIQQITTYGRQYHYGLEVGSKPELLAAIAHLQDPQAYLVCNGYKDAEFIDLALRVQKMGLQVLLVLEMPGELDAVLERAELLGIAPNLGIRVRLAAKGSGHWSDSAGDKSVFGLHVTQLMAVVDQLKRLGKLDYLRMLHFHQGSQIPNILSLREAAIEATRIYADLVAEGARMGLLDLGGGLAVNYEGCQFTSAHGPNYTIGEYCADMVNAIMRVANQAGIPHPDIITESGRAVAAHSAILVFNIVDVNRYFPKGSPPPMPEDAPAAIQDLYEVWSALEKRSLQECFNDAVFYRAQVLQQHVQGRISLRDRALGEQVFAHLMKRFAKVESIPEEMKEVEDLGVDFYYGNFSLFQSLPDTWAIEQLFPTAPIHRLLEEPTRRAVIADITCDCDGRLDQFLSPEGISDYLPVHEWNPGDDYLIGVFLVGAYQETLGDLHNLIGDTHVVSVELDDQGNLRYTHEVEGDSIGEALRYVEYDLADLRQRFRQAAEHAVEEGRITPKERQEFVQACEESLRGYTYFEP